MEENRYKPTKKITLFGQLEKQLRLKRTLLSNSSSYYLFRLLYIFSLGLLYIWNAHFHEKTLYKIHKLQPLVDGLRVKYMELQSSYMLNSKQSEIAKRVNPLDIYESKVPPYTIKSK